ncbi:hypothetical protein BLX87_17220 [Bacillus sp. VT-16-64]|nr:hypothetical protein BLX87_17220 [Bacillus sp. VT-16-64]
MQISSANLTEYVDVIGMKRIEQVEEGLSKEWIDRTYRFEESLSLSGIKQQSESSKPLPG